jgi:hypothetical protein
MRPRLLVLLAAVLVPQVVAGQAIMPGSRVRVTQPGEGTRVGTVVQVTADSLEVRFEPDSLPTHMAVGQVTRLYVSLGKERRVMHRTGVGFLVGSGVGAVWGAIGESDCDSSELFCLGAGGGALLGGVLIGAVGGIVGMVAGLSPSERWERVPLERRRFSLVAPTTGHGKGLGVSLAF